MREILEKSLLGKRLVQINLIDVKMISVECLWSNDNNKFNLTNHFVAHGLNNFVEGTWA